MKLEDYIYSSGRGAREGGMVRFCWSSEVFAEVGTPPSQGGWGRVTPTLQSGVTPLRGE